MKKRIVGRHDGREVEQVVLESAEAAVAILNYGCTVRDWRVDQDGRSLPMVLGFPDFYDYPERAQAHGAICGRIANRTAGAEFTLDGVNYSLTRNNGPHHLHGGAVGLQRRLWEMEGEDAGNAVVLSYDSPDGEEGYPGRVEFTVTYRLEGGRLTCDMVGRPDRPTPINLAHHNYYNLGGGGEVRDHVLQVAARAYTPSRPDLIPLGSIEPVEGTRLDFTEPRSLAEADPRGEGYDNNLVLDPARDRAEPAAVASCPRTGRTLRLWTEEPGLQVFDAAGMTIAARGHDGARYGPFAGLCLEAQHYPDSMHNPEWPSIVRTPDAPYFQRLTVEIARP